MGGSSFHRILYGTAGVAAFLQFIFAAGMTGVSVSELERVGHPTYNLVKQHIVAYGIFQCLVAVATSAYYFTHLCLRKRGTRFTSVGMDFIANALLLALTVVFMLLGWAAVSIWVWVCLGIFVIQVILFLVIIIFEIVYTLKNRHKVSGGMMHYGIDMLDDSRRADMEMSKLGQ